MNFIVGSVVLLLCLHHQFVQLHDGVRCVDDLHCVGLYASVFVKVVRLRCRLLFGEAVETVARFAVAAVEPDRWIWKLQLQSSHQRLIGFVDFVHCVCFVPFVPWFHWFHWFHWFYWWMGTNQAAFAGTSSVGTRACKMYVVVRFHAIPTCKQEARRIVHNASGNRQRA